MNLDVGLHGPSAHHPVVHLCHFSETRLRSHYKIMASQAACTDVRFGSLADIRAQIDDVRFRG